MALKALEDGRTVRDAATAAKVTTKTIYKWAKTDPQLQALIDQTRRTRNAQRGPKALAPPPPPSVVDRVDDPDDLWLEQLQKARRLALATLARTMSADDSKHADKVKAAAEVLKASEAARAPRAAAPPGDQTSVGSKPTLKFVTPSPEDAARRLAL